MPLSFASPGEVDREALAFGHRLFDVPSYFWTDPEDLSAHRDWVQKLLVLARYDSETIGKGLIEFERLVQHSGESEVDEYFKALVLFKIRYRWPVRERVRGSFHLARDFGYFIDNYTFDLIDLNSPLGVDGDGGVFIRPFRKSVVQGALLRPAFTFHHLEKELPKRDLCKAYVKRVPYDELHRYERSILNAHRRFLDELQTIQALDRGAVIEKVNAIRTETHNDPELRALDAGFKLIEELKSRSN